MTRCRNILLGWLLALLFAATANGQTPTTLQPVATQSGLTTAKVISAASTNATSIKNAPGRYYGAVCANNNAAYRYLHLYNKATAPTVGTDVPIITIGIPPANAVDSADDIGVNFALGIALSITTGIADTDATATGANEVVCNIRFN